MLIRKETAPFDNPHFIYELKWEGERCVSYLEPGREPELRNKRNMRMLTKGPELEAVSKQVKKRSDTFKIKLDAKNNPATFLPFDILYYDSQETMLSPLMERKALLSKSVTDEPQMSISRYFAGNGTALYDFALNKGFEGIIAKERESIYIQDKRTTSWIKILILHPLPRLKNSLSPKRIRHLQRRY